MSNYKFYMSRYVDGSWEEEVSLEEFFPGLKYIKSEGLISSGKPKNIYTETYAEESKMRVYIPDSVSRENVEITFTFCFLGLERRKVYKNFIDWLTGYKIIYRDTARNVKVHIVLTDSVEPENDLIIGSNPYILADFKFTNINGNFEFNQ